jgi:DNA-binding PadR family transcriptional regulator
MAEGYIRLRIMNLLLEEKKTGYSLISLIEKDLGKKPSAGTIYPALNKLTEEGLIKYKEKGRKKEYYLTKKGKDSIKKIFSEKKNIVLNHIRYLNQINEENCKAVSDVFTNEFGKDPLFIIKHLKDWKDLKKIAIEIVLSPDYDKKKEKIRKVISNTVKELKSIKEE